MATGGRDQQVARVDPGRVESTWRLSRRVESCRVYEEDDRVDDKLLNKLKGFIIRDHLGTLARHLDFTQADISAIMADNKSSSEQIFEVNIMYHFILKNFPSSNNRGREFIVNTLPAAFGFLLPHLWNTSASSTQYLIHILSTSTNAQFHHC